MKDTTNFDKIKKLFNENGGFITRDDIDRERIPSWFLSDYVRKNNLIKVAPGFYVSDTYFIDPFYILQRRYPKFIFADMSALYIHNLTDKIPAEIEVVAPQGYNPSRSKINGLTIRRISSFDIYNLGVEEVETSFGNTVKAYNQERTICDVIKHRDKYDGETFVKAIKKYVRNSYNQSKLFEYARIMGIEQKVFEVIEVVDNND